MAKEFLDMDGLTHAFTKVKTQISTELANQGITTAGTGAAYTATVDGITALAAGATFLMIPHETSTVVVPTLNVNGLGAKQIRRRVSNSTVTTVASVSANWLYKNKPIRMTYDGTYWIADMDRPNALDIYGTVAIANGGTGVTTLDALKTLVNPNSKGSGIPTTATVGAVGDFYMNTDTGDTYKCTAVENGVYTWKSVGLAPEIGVILPETVAPNEDYVYLENAIVAGETYTVTINGTSYTCVANENIYEGDVYIELGNGTVAYPDDGYEDNGLPFFIEAFEGNDAYFFFASGEDSTVSITGNVYNHIEKKYLPEITNDDLPYIPNVSLPSIPRIVDGGTITTTLSEEESHIFWTSLNRGPVRVSIPWRIGNSYQTNEMVVYNGNSMSAFSINEEYIVYFSRPTIISEELTIRCKKLFDA